MTIGETKIHHNHPVEKHDGYSKEISTSIDLEAGQTFARITLELLMPNHEKAEILEKRVENMVKQITKDL